MGSYLLDGGRWSDLSENDLSILDKPGPITGAIGSLPISGLLLLACHGPTVEPEGRCGIEHDMWRRLLRVDTPSFYGTIAQAWLVMSIFIEGDWFTTMGEKWLKV
jgi:hypothetical protein